MTSWSAALTAREMFVGMRIAITEAEPAEEPRSFAPGDPVRIERQGHDSVEGRILQAGAAGAVLQVADATRWALRPLTHTEKRWARQKGKPDDLWIVRERLP